MEKRDLNFTVYWCKLCFRWQRKDFYRFDEAIKYIDTLDDWAKAEIWFMRTNERIKKYVYLKGGKVDL